MRRHKFEPRHDKTNKMSVRPAKTQISLDIWPVMLWLILVNKKKIHEKNFGEGHFLRGNKKDFIFGPIRPAECFQTDPKEQVFLSTPK